jgi:tRNA pseudouridine38-40 synthase
MVRALVGTSILIGTGKMSVNEFETILKTGTRSDAGNSVAAKGLILTKVIYPN